MKPEDRAQRPWRLREVQKLFYDLATAPTGVAAGLAERGLGAADLETLVRGDQRLSAVERLDVYANMYFYRILDVLRDEYPRVVVAVGEVAFHDLVTDYLLAHRPRHPSLRAAGAWLPGYLQAHPLGSAWPWLPGLALLERTHRELFDGADAPVLMADTLRELPPEAFVGLAVRLIPTHALIEVPFALSTIWENLAAGDRAEPDTRRESLLVWRQGIEVRHRVVDDVGEAAMLALAAGGATMGELCEKMISLGPADQEGDGQAGGNVTRAFQILARWVDDGLLTRVSGAPADKHARGHG